jgi:hypothetical protein
MRGCRTRSISRTWGGQLPVLILIPEGSYSLGACRGAFTCMQASILWTSGHWRAEVCGTLVEVENGNGKGTKCRPDVCSAGPEPGGRRPQQLEARQRHFLTSHIGLSELEGEEEGSY